MPLELNDINLDNVYFQQDGATCYTSNETIEPLREEFPDSVISRSGDHYYTTGSCDLALFDLFLWGHVKNKVFANSPESFQELKVAIRKAIENIGQPLYNLVMENHDGNHHEKGMDL